MIKISEAIKKLYIEDSTPIELEVRFKDNAFPTIKGSDVLSEQMTLHESICEEEQLKFGGCNASSFELTVFNLNSGIKGYEIKPVLITNKTEIPLGVFYVETIEKYAGKDYKKLTAYDKMRYFDVDVKDWYENLTFPISVKDFRDSLCNYVGVEQNEATLIADSIMLTKELDSSSGINGLSLMKQICEISGVFGRIDRYDKFDYLSLESSMLLPADDLYPANDLYPSAGSGSSENSFNIPTSLMYEHPLVEDFFTSNIDGVIIVDSEGAEYITENKGNPYYIQDNFVIIGQSYDTITQLAVDLAKKISNISYRPVNSSKIKGQPYVECGDFISGEVNGYGFEAYVFQRDLTGVKALRDSYICKGKELLENDMNGITATLQRLNSSIGKVKVEIKKTEDGLVSKVSKGDVSTEISQESDVITIRGNRFIVESDNLKIDRDGTMTFKAGVIEDSVSIKNVLRFWISGYNRYFDAIKTEYGYATETEGGYLHLCEPYAGTSLFSVYGGYSKSEQQRDSRVDCYTNLHVEGQVYSLGTGSDKDIKKDVSPLDKLKTSNFIYALNPVSYKYKKGNRNHHGLIAQELKLAMDKDDWGVYCDKEYRTGKKGGKSIRYEELIADLIATVQSQNDRIKALEDKSRR